MKSSNIRNSLCAIIAGLAVNGATTQAADDPIVASFQRDLNHQPAPVEASTRSAVAADVLYRLINRPLQSPADPVAASFSRAFPQDRKVAGRALTTGIDRDHPYGRVSARRCTGKPAQHCR